MLMTTNEPAPARRPQRDDGRRGRGAVPADDLSVAGLSGRRVLLFQRHRMGGGGRRYHRCRLACATGSRRCWPTDRDFATACFWRRRIARPPRAMTPSLRDIAELAAAFVPSRERQLETSTQGRAFIEIARAAWSCDGLDQSDRRLRRPDRLSRRGRPGQRRACNSAGAGACTPSCMRWCRTGFPQAAGWCRSGKPTASACSPHSSRWSLRPPARALEASLDDLGSATFRADLASLRHETQYTRLFRS